MLHFYVAVSAKHEQIANSEIRSYLIVYFRVSTNMIVIVKPRVVFMSRVVRPMMNLFLG